MIDPATLAFTVTHFLLPHLDYIRGKVADAALTESGKALVSVLKEKWIAKSETAQAAIADAAADPTDPDKRDAVVTELRKALKSDSGLAQRGRPSRHRRRRPTHHHRQQQQNRCVPRLG